MPPAPHRRAISIPDAVFLASGTEALTSSSMAALTTMKMEINKPEPPQQQSPSLHSRRNSPTSVIAAADHAVFAIREEGEQLKSDDGGANPEPHPLLAPSPPKDGLEDPPPSPHPLLRVEPATARPFAADDLHLPSRPEPRSHRRCQTDPCVQRLPFLQEEQFVLDGLCTCLKTHLSTLGDAHPRVGLLYNQIGTFHFRRRDFAAAEDAYHEALRCFRAAFRSGHAGTTSIGHGIKGSLAVASTLGNVGAVHWKTGRLSSAVAYLEEALRIQERVAARVAADEAGAGKDKNRGGQDRRDRGEEGSVDIAQTLHNLGIALTLGGNYRRAKRSLRRALAMFERHCGPYHVDVARVQDALGRLHALRSRPRKSLECHVAALRIKNAILNPRHPSLLSSAMKVAACHRALGQLDECERVLREVLEGQGVALLRSMDPEYRRCVAALAGGTMRMIGEVQRERNERAKSAIAVPPKDDEADDEADDDACTLTLSLSDGETGEEERPTPPFCPAVGTDDWGV